MRRLIIVIICLIFSAVLVFGLVLPKKDNLELLQKKINEKKTELQSKEGYFSDLEKISQELKKYQTQLSKIDSASPGSSQSPALFDFLQKVSSQTGLILKSVNPVSHKPSAIIEGAEESILTLAVSGRYPSFKNFLSVLENSSRLFGIESISFSVGEDISDFNLRVKVYSH